MNLKFLNKYTREFIIAALEKIRGGKNFKSFCSKTTPFRSAYLETFCKDVKYKLCEYMRFYKINPSSC